MFLHASMTGDAAAILTRRLAFGTSATEQWR